MGVAAALRVRRAAGLGLVDAVPIYDLAQELGVDVRFMELASLEGFYIGPDNPAIVISSLRPAGRQAFTCAHELGHHILGHGVTIDELQKERENPSLEREFMADNFAGILLMPRAAVRDAFSSRGLRSFGCEPLQAYSLACWFGVGYTTFVHHLRSALRMFDQRQADRLLRVPVKKLKAAILGRETVQRVVAVDPLWNGRSLDLAIGDFVVCKGSVESQGRVLQSVERGDRAVFRASRRGQGTVFGCGWTCNVRVSADRFTGRYVYRYLGESSDE